MHKIPPYWVVTSSRDYREAVTLQVAGRTVPILAQVPAGAWLVVGVACSLVLLLFAVAVAGAYGRDTEQRGDAIEVLKLVVGLVAVICRVVRPAAFPGEQDSTRRLLRRTRRQATTGNPPRRRRQARPPLRPRQRARHRSPAR